jgi:leucyl-tRNA---protein transferase
MLDVIELITFQSPPAPCPYLPDETASLVYRIVSALTSRSYQELLARGWRRFGSNLFRPACPRCVKCRSLRVPVERFRPSRSQRRLAARSSGLRMIVQWPTITDRHLALYNAYHEDMRRRRGWPGQEMTAETYEMAFLAEIGDFAREFLYFDGNRLIGVGLVDVLPDALSSVYFYHDPEYRARGLGVFSILQEIEFARGQGIRHQYLGYWIAECQSMAYKSQYGPHEILEGLPADDEPPVWREPFASAQAPT